MGRTARGIGTWIRTKTAAACAAAMVAVPAVRAQAQWIVQDPMAILQQLLTDLDLVTGGDLTLEKLMVIMEHSADMKDKLFGTAAAFGEGATLYRDCISLVEMSDRYMRVTCGNYNRLMAMYRNMEDWTGRDYAAAIGDAENLITSYQGYCRSIQELVSALKKDSRTIEAKREALQKATEQMRSRMAAQTDSVDAVIRSELYSSALSRAVDALDVWSDREVEAMNRIHGYTVESERGSSWTAGSVGKVALLLISLILIAETLAAGMMVMRGRADWEMALTRLLISYVAALVIIITIGRYI